MSHGMIAAEMFGWLRSGPGTQEMTNLNGTAVSLQYWNVYNCVLDLENK